MLDGWWQSKRTKRTDRAVRVSENEKKKRGASRGEAERYQGDPASANIMQQYSNRQHGGSPICIEWEATAKTCWLDTQSEEKQKTSTSVSLFTLSVSHNNITHLYFLLLFFLDFHRVIICQVFSHLTSCSLELWVKEISWVLNCYIKELHQYLLSPNWWRPLFYSCWTERLKEGKSERLIIWANILIKTKQGMICLKGHKIWCRSCPLQKEWTRMLFYLYRLKKILV